MRIGVLAVQGAFIEHERIINSLGHECVELRQKSDIKNLDGLILPGGESTVQGKLLRELDMFDPLKTLIDNGLPTLGTCAGLILLAQNLSNDPNTYFASLPITVRRNAYGRQLGSFKCVSDFKGLGDIKMTFIRAPFIENPGSTEVAATVDGNIVAVRYKNQIGLAFHPELDSDKRIHEAFLDLCKKRQ